MEYLLVQSLLNCLRHPLVHGNVIHSNVAVPFLDDADFPSHFAVLFQSKQEEKFVEKRIISYILMVLTWLFDVVTCISGKILGVAFDSQCCI